MNYWNQAPLFRLLPAFVSGILCSVFHFDFHPWAGCIAIVVCIAILAFSVYQPQKYYSYKRRWIFGMATHLSIFSFAFILTGLKTEINQPDHFSKTETATAYLAYLDVSKVEKSKSFKATIRIVAAKTKNGWKNVNGKCLAYISKDSLAAKLSYGDLIIFTLRPSEVPPPQNPGQFDYKRYLFFNQVCHQVFLKPSSWHLIANHKGNAVVEMAIQWKEKLLKIFKDNQINGDDYAVISALLLGDTAEIDQEIMKAYAASGALHVLSVSGLHVGIIYIGLSTLLFFLNRNRKTKIIRAGILILFLWFYALLTGLSPAVLRSSAMLTFIVIGSSLERTTNMYNTVAASAIVLLCFQPFLLMQVGFQLSYLAVLGIVFLYKKIQLFMNPENWLWKQVWGLTAVSVAAQLTTFPLGLFYFHQFPNYFLLANLLVIPLSTLIIYGGILLFFVSPVASLASWIGLALGKMVHLLNWFVIRTEHLPYSLLNGISITSTETILLYFLLLALVLYLMKKQVSYFYAMAISIICILALQIDEARRWQNQKQIIIYNIPKTSAINLIDGRDAIMLSDSAFANSRNMLAFHVYPYLWESGVDEEKAGFLVNDHLKQTRKKFENILFYKNYLMAWDKSILVLSDARQINRISEFPLKVDYLVLSRNVKIHLADLRKKIHFNQLIIDSSNSIFLADRWQKEAFGLGIGCHSVQHNGAFVMRF